MKGVLRIAFLPALGFLLVSCSASEEACMQECGSINLKSHNMCALENENDYSDELECSIKANKVNNKCLGKCLGNI
jgi:hypothetical protein